MQSSGRKLGAKTTLSIDEPDGVNDYCMGAAPAAWAATLRGIDLTPGVTSPL